jgi:hypothetical protein
MDYPKITSGLISLGNSGMLHIPHKKGWFGIKIKHLLICELITRQKTRLFYLIRIVVGTQFLNMWLGHESNNL